MTNLESHDQHRISQKAKLYRDNDQNFAEWASGYGVIRHTDWTQVQIYELNDWLLQNGFAKNRSEIYKVLRAADRLSNAAMWLVVHMTYAKNVYSDGRDLSHEDFKKDPQGHTGGSLNMVPAYVGYLTINTLTHQTRSWLMGQGHCVAAIDSVNLLVGNTTEAHAKRYDTSEQGLTRFVRDFYSYEVSADGSPKSPLGSHVNANTAGGLIEGGYLGFAELQYVHMPLPGERLVAFLSDGAFEEQRGSDWVPRWWRAEDCGLVAPIMIANGRRIDQRTTMSQQGGVSWFHKHLLLNGFDPIGIDGRDPAAFAWAIFEMEERSLACSQSIQSGYSQYPSPLHYTVAEAPKGYGFEGAGTNLAHGTPLAANPAYDAEALRRFNEGARRLWVPPKELSESIRSLNTHKEQNRLRERDHSLAKRSVPTPRLPSWKELVSDTSASPMSGIDQYFCQIIKSNPGLRPRVGNPDELSSNKMNQTLNLLKHRVTDPEKGVAESIDGAVITALNEEAVVSAALSNKAGINLVVSYEAFAVKMLGALRQEIIFARHQIEAGNSPRWLSVPIILSSHLWENGKNEQSHQDPTLCEALLGEMSDMSRVGFPACFNSACAAMQAAYSTHAQIWTLVISKKPQKSYFSQEMSLQLVKEGAGIVKGVPEAPIQIVAIGSYQLEQALIASTRLDKLEVSHSVVYLFEPGRFREGRDTKEKEFLTQSTTARHLFSQNLNARIFISHMRPESLLGIVRPLDLGKEKTRSLGYLNRGGTLDVMGLLFANRCTWAHILANIADLLNVKQSEWLRDEEILAVTGRGDPSVILKDLPES